MEFAPVDRRSYLWRISFFAFSTRSAGQRSCFSQTSLATVSASLALRTTSAWPPLTHTAGMPWLCRSGLHWWARLTTPSLPGSAFRCATRQTNCTLSGILLPARSSRHLRRLSTVRHSRNGRWLFGDVKRPSDANDAPPLGEQICTTFVTPASG